jgi:hypothetical protein
MIESMNKKDTATLRKCFTPGAQLMTYTYDSQGNPRVKSIFIHEFLKQIALIGETEIEEKLTGWQCYTDEGIASVWTPYEFYFDHKFTHCGVNSFQVMKIQGVWKITQVEDSRRTQDCIVEAGTIQVIDSLLNEWHHAAAIADEKTFFGRMAEDAIYIGTDPGERWMKNELIEWSRAYFERKSAWEFKPLSRNIKIGPGGELAWFDELLDTKMGTCRSTGILVKQDDTWKIVHYQLSVAVPNDKLDKIKKLIGEN